jgi:hypothetical protein
MVSDSDKPNITQSNINPKDSLSVPTDQSEEARKYLLDLHTNKCDSRHWYQYIEYSVPPWSWDKIRTDFALQM